MNRKWTKRDEALLRKLYSCKSLDEIASRLGRTSVAIKSRANVLRVTKGTRRTYTAEEVQAVIELYPNTVTKKIALMLGRSAKR